MTRTSAPRPSSADLGIIEYYFTNVSLLRCDGGMTTLISHDGETTCRSIGLEIARRVRAQVCSIAPILLRNYSEVLRELE